MRLSTRSRYSVRALLDILVNGGDYKPVPLSEISERQDLSEKYLEQLFIKLKKEGIVKAKRGRGGGYLLAKSPEKITLGEVLRLTELDVTPVNCHRCKRTDKCICKVYWDDLGDIIMDYIDSVTLEDINQKAITVEEKMSGDLSEVEINLKEEIKRLKDSRKAVILVHNYQSAEIQEIADYLGDSLDLSRRASKLPHKVIVFCGVKFMAESAKVLAPQKTVLLPSYDAGCPLADMITVDELREMKKEYPKAKVVCYVNTAAEIKAESDICCTSANAVSVVNSLKAKQVIFVPDRNLANYVSKHSKKDIIPWNGFCYVHEFIEKSEIEELKKLHPKAKVVVHPETKPEVVDIADYVLGTGGMVKLAKESKHKEFIIGTEEGLVIRLRRENPRKQFYLPARKPICSNMKKTHLEDVYYSLRDMKYRVELDKQVIKKAKKSLQKMISIG
jgi:quinolinate synthase